MKAKRPLFKTFLAETIQHHIAEKRPLYFSWSCQYCHDEHRGDMLKKAASLKLDPDLEIGRQDIGLIDKAGKVFAIIQIAATRVIKKSALEFFKRQQIILIQIPMPSTTDSEIFQKTLSHPSLVTTCLNPRCEKCGDFKQITKLIIVDGPCWKCSATIKIAAIRKAGYTLGPDEFSLAEIQAARTKSANIQERYSNTMDAKYLVNTCQCGAFVGNHYLFTEYIAPGTCGMMPFQQFDIGYHCEACFEAMSR